MTGGGSGVPRSTRGGRQALAWPVAIASVAVLVAAPWLRQELVPAAWLGVAGGLILVTGRRGWRSELAVLASAAIAITLAFHWTPQVLSEAMRSSRLVGFAFAAPIILWDACRLALPFWIAGRVVRDPRDAWLPAGLTAVVAEAVFPGVFPWKLGYCQLAWPVTVQSAALLGPEGPTLAIYATAGAVVAAVGGIAGWRGRRLTAGGLAAVAVATANVLFGIAAVARTEARMVAAPKLRLALVQADPDASDSIEAFRRLTRQACGGGRPVDLVCWPECSGGSYEEGLESFTDEAAIFRRSRPPRRGLRPLPEPDCPLLFGGRIYRGFRERPNEIFQAALLLDERERLAGCYHKRHLMPFGEYVPFADVIPELRLSFPMETDYDAGSESVPIDCGPARIGALLCYEDMVPAAAATLVAERANVLVSLIHGSAFTNPLTLRQHRLLAQQRSVELRRCLARCSSTGETCLIDAAGRITDRLPLGDAGLLVVELPLLEEETLATRWPGVFPALCGLGLVTIGLRGRLRRLGGLAV
jgi:apolipoprotein N-acyltransferase